MKAYGIGDRVQVRGKVSFATSDTEQVVNNPVGRIMGLEITASGDRGARVAMETPLGTIAKLVLVRQLRRA